MSEEVEKDIVTWLFIYLLAGFGIVFICGFIYTIALFLMETVIHHPSILVKIGALVGICIIFVCAGGATERLWMWTTTKEIRTRK